ncbi:MAG: aminoacyl-histidine dipeptidase [Bacteroidota bacterium]
MTRILEGLEPKTVWYYFEEITKYPHPSKKEEKLANYILGWAKEKNFENFVDKTGNIVIRKPATKGMENRKPIAFQGHIDMVCEKNSDVTFDFDNDPIQIYVDGDWIKAKGTTLGADNGIGVAMGMAVLDSTDIPHPDVELLCTVDEETGLTGAMQLEGGVLKAKILINLDSEEDAAFTIGCAGGINTSGTFEYKTAPVAPDSTAFELAVKGLRGGHSGIEIHDGRGNAIKILNRLLNNLNQMFNIQLSSIAGGNKHNAIPRESFAVITVPKKSEADFVKYVKEYDVILKAEYLSKEPDINIIAKSVALPAKVMSYNMQCNLISSFYVMPHGVIRMSPDIQGLVQTSTNFAIVETRENEVYVLTSQRSSVETEKVDMARMVYAALELGGAKVVSGDGYPAWQPNVNSPILKEAAIIFKQLRGVEPRIEAIHAGLETGLIGEKYPGMDMLSFGPNLKDVHSPAEKISISSTEMTWKLLLEIVKNIPLK